MVKRTGMYKSEKRKKELTKQKKQEAKRQKRLEKGVRPAEGEEAGAAEGSVENNPGSLEEENGQQKEADQAKTREGI